MPQTPARPTQVQMLEEALGALQDRLRTATVGRVVTYNPSTQTATIAPQIWDRSAAGEDVPAQPIPEVPVVWIQGGGTSVTVGLAPGDPVLLMASDRAIDRWQTLGSPGFSGAARRHALTDAVAIAGVGSATDTIAGAAAAPGELVIVTAAGVALRVSPAGTVSLAEGVLPVARQTDPVAPTAAFTAWIAQVNAAFAAPGVAALLAAASVPIPVPPASLGTIAGGNPEVTA